MKFIEKYTLDKTVKDEEEKIQISKESFAVCEMIQVLVNKLEQLRVSNGN